MKKKSQSSLEFIGLFSIAAVIAIVIIAIVYKEIVQVTKEQEYILVKDLALKVQSEISIASNAQDGFKRKFDIPEKLEYKNFSISVNATHLIVKSENIDFFAFIPKVNGQILKGNNTIEKKNGIIYLNE